MPRVFLILLLLNMLFLQLACNQVTSDSSDLSSLFGCPGADPVNPPLPLPNFITRNGKISSALFTQNMPVDFGPNSLAELNSPKQILAKNTEVVALVDHRCVYNKLNKNADSNLLSATLVKHRGNDKNNGRLTSTNTRFYPYTWTTTKTHSRQALTQMMNDDPCLLSLSESPRFFPFANTNDPMFSELAHLTAIKAPTAYDTLYSAGGPTQEVVVAIIDTGVQLDHPDLLANLWINSGEVNNGIDDDGNGYIDDVNGYDFASNSEDPSPKTTSQGHGTHVAGLTAARSDNSIGIAGVMGQNIKIMALNVFGSNPSASTTSIVEAINYAKDNGADIINMSLGGAGTSPDMLAAMKSAAAAGVAIFVAAGNSAAQITKSHFVIPAGYAAEIDGVLSVGSTDATSGALSSFSNFSTQYVEIAAPGSNSATGGLKSTWYSATPSTYDFKQGTSMASPVAAGVGAWAVSLLKENGVTVSAKMIEDALMESADIYGDLSPFIKGGKHVNLLNLVSTINDCFNL